MDDKSARDVTVRLGGTEAGRGQMFSVRRIYIPNENASDFNFLSRDIALLELSIPAVGYTFALLNGNSTVPVPESFNRAVGYGRKEIGGFLDGELFQVDVPTLAPDTCKKEYIWWFDDGTICTLYPNRHDCSVCHGDSGGPLLQYDVNGSPVVLGVASFTVFCNTRDFPGGFTRVSPLIEWMGSVGAEFNVSKDASQVFSSSAMSHSPTASPSLCPTVLPNSSPNREIQPFNGIPALRVGSPASMDVARLMVSIVDVGVRCAGVLISRTWALIGATCDFRNTTRIYLGGRNMITGYQALAKKIYRWRQVGSRGNVMVTLIELERDTIDTSATALVSAKSISPLIGSYARVLVYDVFNNLSPSGYDGTLRQYDVSFTRVNRCGKRNAKSFLCTSALQPECCPWEDGSPLFQFTSEGRPVLVGILSEESSCFDDKPVSLFLKVSHFLPWIRSTGAVFEETNASIQFVPSAKPSQSVPSPSAPPLSATVSPFAPFPSATPAVGSASPSTGGIPSASKVPALSSLNPGSNPVNQTLIEDAEGTNVGVVISSVVAGVVLATAVAVVIVFALRKRRDSTEGEVPINI